jgi:integral membrane protein (TIGR01906 family)
VRDLYKAIFTILNIAVVLSMIFMFLLLIAVKRTTLAMTEKEGIEYFKKLISSMLIWIGACVDFIAVLFAIVVVTFSSSFITFHELLFKTDTWMLDPATDNLIRMFPEQFFYDIFVRIVLMSVVFATILLVVGYVMRLGKPKMLRKDQGHN